MADVFLPDSKSVLDATHIARCFLPAPYKPAIDALEAIAIERKLAPVAEANARLISAAPELLEALEYVVRQLADGDNPELDEYGDEIDPFERARAAIAKAEGRS